MATDGTKIIDGDTAHDTYWGIMDLYDSEAGLEMILNEFPLVQPDYFDSFDNEIYVTSCGLAYWEIGLMTTERIEYIENVISKNACVNEWTKLSDKEGKSRKSVLTRFLNKIKKENTKIRKPKKYRKISNFIFNENDILSFKLKDDSYRSLICMKIDQYRGNCNYWFVPTIYKSFEKPTEKSVTKEMILGRTIGSGYDKETTRKEQSGIELIWDYVGGNPKFFFGFVIDAVEHKDLLKFKDSFERIGSVNIIDGLKKTGSFGYSENFERFEEKYDDLDKQISIFGYKKYPIEIMIKK
ncbi:hypothetical protein LNJ05_12280 [Tenacibaculum finnmarkense genomovar ulcerans]|uniref:hypothetical protein n=1 Tax=Tenacibaculum finnmarkense TaxID=2781243 RepID=UPI001E613766|nr:hypothetical protein [Tenacibaculum finnmarkense]MCD8433539.1 hypothetical protein [Tenacibaculum finnmarkense genomovar ulcerans]MCG8860086.1 hypothetical protein [Tenacibaculum finnmarkense]